MTEPGREGGFRYESDDWSRWHAIQTNNGADQVADQALSARGYETLFLHYHDQARHARRTRDVVRPYFPGYLFVRVGIRQPHYPIAFCQGVSTLVCAGRTPLSVPLEVIDELRARADPAGCLDLPREEKKSRRRYLTGDRIRIVGGPLAGLLAVVALDKGATVHVWLALFSGRVRVDLSPDQTSPARRSNR